MWCRKEKDGADGRDNTRVSLVALTEYVCLGGRRIVSMRKAL